MSGGKPLHQNFVGVTIMCNNGFFGCGNNSWWIIFLIWILFCGCGCNNNSGFFSNNNCGCSNNCGCDNNCNCGC